MSEDAGPARARLAVVPWSTLSNRDLAADLVATLDAEVANPQPDPPVLDAA